MFKLSWKVCLPLIGIAIFVAHNVPLLGFILGMIGVGFSPFMKSMYTNSASGKTTTVIGIICMALMAQVGIFKLSRDLQVYNYTDNEMVPYLEEKVKRKDNSLDEKVEIYTKLAQLTKKKEYQEKAAFYTRRYNIENQFGRMGQHKRMGWSLKEQLHDPGSFKHVRTTYRESGEYLIVTMTYRANNRLGIPGLAVATAQVAINNIDDFRFLSIQ